MIPELPPINDLWDYKNPAATEKRFRELLPLAESAVDGAYYLQLLTQIARTHSLRRNFSEAHQLLDEVQARMAGSDVVEVRYLLERGRSFNSSGQPELAEPLFLQAYELADATGEAGYAVDALHMLGIAAPADARLAWNLRAIDYAHTSSDERARKWLGSLYNNTGWTYFEQQDYDSALAFFEEALVQRHQAGNPEFIRIARWCIGRALRALGRIREALDIQRELEQYPDHDGFVDEEIAECLLELKRIDEAQPYFLSAYERLSQIDWVTIDTARLERLRQFSGLSEA